jgi:hypothetical protein
MPLSSISWRRVLVVEEAGVPWENHRPWASKFTKPGVNRCLFFIYM